MCIIYIYILYPISSHNFLHMFVASPSAERFAKLHMVSRRTKAVRQSPVFSATRMASLAMAGRAERGSFCRDSSTDTPNHPSH